MASRWIRPEVYPLFATTGVAVGICAMQLVRNITTNPEVSFEEFGTEQVAPMLQTVDDAAAGDGCGVAFSSSQWALLPQTLEHELEANGIVAGRRDGGRAARRSLARRRSWWWGRGSTPTPTGDFAPLHHQAICSSPCRPSRLYVPMRSRVVTPIHTGRRTDLPHGSGVETSATGTGFFRALDSADAAVACRNTGTTPLAGGAG
uniref:Uncharacterized protein n=1 Tax=Oryza meridionalis TaxID=40149 RepID=A0A0E0EA32_9ORYZ